MAKKVTLKVDPGMWSNLTDEFGTDDPYELIKELHEARSFLLGENNDLRRHAKDMINIAADLRADRDAASAARAEVGVERDRMRTERDATSAQLIAARRDRDETVAEFEHELENADTALDVARAELERTRLDLAAIRNDLDQVREGTEFLGEAAGRNAAERDAWHRMSTAWGRSAREWRKAAYEAQAAALRYRDADVAALTIAVDEALELLEEYDPGISEHYEAMVVSLRAALRPFARVVRAPLVGEIEDHDGLQNHVAWRMTRERIDAARPRGMARDEATT